MVRVELEASPEYMKDIQPTRLREGDLTNICRIYAIWDGLDILCKDETFKRRVQTIPNEWRDLKMMLSKIEKLAIDLMFTVPEEKRQGVSRALGRMRYYITQGPVASIQRHSDEQVLRLIDLKALTHASWQGNCQLCVDGNCKQCELGKALDNVVDIDRNNGSWSTIDILD